MAEMKTTLNLPDDLMRSVKIRAAEQNKKLQDLVAELIRRGLETGDGEPETRSHRVRLPLIECGPASPGEEMTPERTAAILLEEEGREPLR